MWTPFRPTGKKSITGGPRPRRSLGRAYARRQLPGVWHLAVFMVPSLDGAFIYYAKSDSSGIFRAGKSGLNEELVYNSEGTGLFFFPLLLFPGGNDLLAAGFSRTCCSQMSVFTE